MDCKVIALVIFCCCTVNALPQDDIFHFSRRKSTTQDPVDAFFKACNDRRGVCVADCNLSNRASNAECASKSLICCNLEDSVDTYVTQSPSTSITTTRTTTTTEDVYVAQDCGVRQTCTGISSRIGNDAERREFPWNVGIFTRSKNDFDVDQNVFQCSGTVIDDFVIMTAASCVSRKNRASLFVFAGLWNNEDGDENRQIVQVKRVISHPQYHISTKVYDVALLILEDKVDFSSTVNRICLPDISENLEDSECFVTGWGESTSAKTVRKVMKVVELLLVDDQACAKTMRAVNRNFELNKIFQCARTTEAPDLCPTDVGSPLFCTIPGRQRQFYQVGIYTRLQNSNECIELGHFNKISHIRKWIDKHVEEIERLTNIYSPQPYDYSENICSDAG